MAFKPYQYTPPSNGVSKIKPFTKGSEKIGDTLFVNGVPFVDCARCGIPIRLHDSNKIVIGRWPKKEEKLILDEATNMLSVKDEKVPPILRTTHGCRDCYTKQAIEMEASKRNKKPYIVFYQMGECEGERNALKPGRFPNERKKQWTVGTKSQKGFNTTVTT